MKSIQLLCLMIWVLALAGCNPKSDSQKAESTPAEEQKTGTDISSAKNEGHDYTFLTHQMLHYKASVTNGKDPKEQPYAGQWIDLDPDGTFKAGKLSKQTHKGKWSYNHDAGILFIQPDDKNFKTSEWKVLFNDDMIVLIGTETYKDNPTQIQLMRGDKFPE